MTVASSPSPAPEPTHRRAWHARARMLATIASIGVVLAAVDVLTLPPAIDASADAVGVTGTVTNAVTARPEAPATRNERTMPAGAATAAVTSAAAATVVAAATPSKISTTAVPAAPTIAPSVAKATVTPTVKAPPVTPSAAKASSTPAAKAPPIMPTDAKATATPAAKAPTNKPSSAKPATATVACSALVAAAQYKDAVSSCTSEAEAGNILSQRRLGLLLAEGRGVKRDESEAAQWFSEAANGGDAESMYLFAQTLEKGRGVKVDAEGAMKWYAQAANGGVAAAMYALGDIYEHGKLGVRADRERALEAYRKAAAKHYGNAASKVRSLSH